MNTNLIPQEIWHVIAYNDYFVFKSLFFVNRNINMCMNVIKNFFILKYPIENIIPLKHKHSVKNGIFLNKCEEYTSTTDIVNIIKYSDNTYES